MSFVAPDTSRVLVERLPGVLRLTIRVRRNWAMVLFLGAWLGGWFMGESFAIRQLFFAEGRGPGQAFLGFWLVGWTVGGAVAGLTFLWGLVGREVITVDHRALTVRHCVGPLGRSLSFDVREITALRAGATPSAGLAWSRLSFPGLATGPIAFDYGARTRRLGASLEGSDVELVLRSLRERLPSPATARM